MWHDAAGFGANKKWKLEHLMATVTEKTKGKGFVNVMRINGWDWSDTV